MKPFFIKFQLGLLLLTASVTAAAAPKAELWDFWNESQASSVEVVDHSRWQQILDSYLDAAHSSGINRFDYAALTDADKTLLNTYLDDMQQQDPRQLNRDEQKAYWLNLYNAVTVQQVVAAYPVSSILKVSGGIFNRGPWNKDWLNIAGQKLSLNDIEHRILRPIWQDARIHFGVNCASYGCPNLLAKAFTAANTERLLEAAARAYLAHPRGLFLDGDELKLSKIFDWYRSDFAENEQQLLSTLSQWLNAETAALLTSFSGAIKYDYDWSLNKP